MHHAEQAYFKILFVSEEVTFIHGGNSESPNVFLTFIRSYVKCACMNDLKELSLCTNLSDVRLLPTGITLN